MDLNNLSLFKAVFESTADGILIVDTEGQIILYNTRFKELWGFPEEVLSTNNDNTLIEYILSQLVDSEYFTSRVNELYQDAKTVSQDYIAFKDGRFFERFSRPLIIESEFKGRLWSFRDLTEQKKNRELLAAITSLSPDIISIIGSDGLLTFNSEASERIHGYKKDELIGKNTTELIHEEDRSIVQQAMAEVLSTPNGQSSVQYRYKNKDNSYSWMEATASNQSQNPLIQGLVTISREIGVRKKLEKDLSSALKLRDVFISIASHELKTPITSLLLQLQMFQRKGHDHLVQITSDNVDGLIEQVRSLQRLTDDLLSVSQIRTGKLTLQLQKLCLSNVLGGCIDRLRNLFADVHCDLKIDVEPEIYVQGDKLRLEQVINNILSNAIKYAPKCLIEISLKGMEKKCILRVRDFGKGIPSEKHNSIFGLFERGSSTGYVSGLGIGLFISKSIILDHQGSITIDPKVTKGTAFVIELPLVTN